MELNQWEKIHTNRLTSSQAKFWIVIIIAIKVTKLVQKVVGYWDSKISGGFLLCSQYFT